MCDPHGMPPTRLPALLLLGVLGCPAAELEGVPTPASDHAPAVVCPADAPTLGVAGETRAERFELPWTSDGLDSFVADYQYFTVPDDVLSLLVAVEQGSELSAINILALDGDKLIDRLADPSAAPFFHEPIEVASVTLPINAQTRPHGGCLAIDPVVYADVRAQTGSLHIVTRRGPSVATQLDVNVFVVGATEISDADIMAALTHMDGIYAGGGAATLGEVVSATLDWPSAYVDAEGSEAAALRAAALADNPSALNVLFVQDFNEVGTLGIAAGTPGPNGVSGTAASAVMVSVDTHLDGQGQALLTTLMGETLAHELGHQIGLFHTTEAEGDVHDPIDDTPECAPSSDDDRDKELSAEECEAADGRNFMFWTAAEQFEQREMSPVQVEVLRDSVIARPQ